MAGDIETIVSEVSLDAVIAHWKKDYKLKKGEGELIRIDHYVDVQKGKVAFILRIKK